MADDVVLRIEGLWKKYGLEPPKTIMRAKGWLRSKRYGGRRPTGDYAHQNGPWALRDINLEVRRGETLGIVGRNGAGKSTLLKVLAGVTPPTRGRYHASEQMYPMIELNAGLHMDLTGRENVSLLAAISGLSRAETRLKMPDIQEFCELGEWFDKPVRTYSGGMLARLGFSVALQSQANILLVDEVLAVGDIGFQRKCLNRIHMLASKGTTVILVSHWMDLIRSVSKSGIFMNEGQIISRGDIQSVIVDYINSSHQQAREQSAKPESRDYPGPREGKVSITKIEVFGEGTELPRDEVVSGENVTIRLHYESAHRIHDPSFGVSIWTANGVRLSTAGTALDGFEIDSIDGSGYCECRFSRLPLLPGAYFIRAGIYDSVTTWPYHRIGWDDLPIELTVKGSMKLSKNRALTPDHGIVHFDTSWKIQ